MEGFAEVSYQHFFNFNFCHIYKDHSNTHEPLTAVDTYPFLRCCPGCRSYTQQQEVVVHSDIVSLTFNVGSACNWKWPSSEISLEEALNIEDAE